MILGQEGTGKSHVINAIKNILGNHCAVAASTGKASYNVKGSSLHSLLKLPIGNKGLKELSGQISLIMSQSKFGWIDRRCRQTLGHKDVLGGKSVILVGDPAQLPPVGDKCL